MGLCRIMKLYNFDLCGLRILIPDAALDALGDTPNVGTGQAGAVDHHHGSLDAVVHEIGGLIDRDQEDTQEDEVGGGGHGSEQEGKVRTTSQLLLN